MLGYRMLKLAGYTSQVPLTTRFGDNLTANMNVDKNSWLGMGGLKRIGDTPKEQRTAIDKNLSEVATGKDWKSDVMKKRTIEGAVGGTLGGTLGMIAGGGSGKRKVLGAAIGGLIGTGVGAIGGLLTTTEGQRDRVRDLQKNKLRYKDTLHRLGDNSLVAL